MGKHDDVRKERDGINWTMTWHFLWPLSQKIELIIDQRPGRKPLIKLERGILVSTSI